MNFTQLQAFVALVDTGSFTEAAYAINLTQSAVSHALSTLEAELGVTLFERSRKGVIALTGVGQKILPHARALLAQMEAIEQEAKAAHGLTMGKLRLGSTPTIISPDLLAGLLTHFQRQYPDVKIVLFEGTMQEVAEWIENSVVDVGLALRPANCLDSTLIMTDELCVVLPPRHRLHQSETVSPADLNAEGFIMAKNECTMQFLRMTGLNVDQNMPPIRYQATDNATILAMVREGLGITVLPRTTLPKRLDGLVVLPIEPPQRLEIGLVMKTQEAASPATKLFVQTTGDWMQAQQPSLVS